MTETRQTPDLSFAAYVQAARFHPWAIVVPMVLLGVVAWLAFGRQPVVYEASAEVSVEPSVAQGTVDNSINQRVNDASFKANEIRFAGSDTVLFAVQERMGDDAPDSIDDLDVSVSADEEADLLEFSAEASTPEGAADLANAYAETYVEMRRSNAVDGFTATIATIESQLDELQDEKVEISAPLTEILIELSDLSPDSNRRPAVEAEAAAIEARIAPRLGSIENLEATLIDQLTTLQISQNLARSGTAFVSSEAVPNPEPKPNAGLRALIVGELVGLLLGLMAAVALERTNDRFREADDVAVAFPDLPILGSLPYSTGLGEERSLTVLRQPSSAFAESVYQVRTSLKFLTMDRGVRLVVVTSSQPSEGKTTFSTNFAWAMAGLDEPVVLIDGDLRRPVAHEHFGVEVSPGLTDMIIDRRSLESVAVGFEELEDRFSLIPAGSNHGNPADFLGSAVVGTKLREISQSALTIIDAAPVLPVSDARPLAGAADLTILMVKVGSTKKSDVQASVRNLRAAGAKHIALVLVGVKAGAKTYYTEERSSRESGPKHPRAIRRVSSRSRSRSSSVTTRAASRSLASAVSGGTASEGSARPPASDRSLPSGSSSSSARRTPRPSQSPSEGTSVAGATPANGVPKPSADGGAKGSADDSKPSPKDSSPAAREAKPSSNRGEKSADSGSKSDGTTQGSRTPRAPRSS